MTWVGAGVCFLVWVGYGALLARRSQALRARLRAMSRGRRVFLGSGGLLLGMAALIVGLYTIASFGGATSAGVALWAWPLVALVGLVFVHAQVMGGAALASLAGESETAGDGKPSGTPEN